MSAVSFTRRQFIFERSCFGKRLEGVAKPALRQGSEAGAQSLESGSGESLDSSRPVSGQTQPESAGRNIWHTLGHLWRGRPGENSPFRTSRAGTAHAAKALGRDALARGGS